MHVPVSVIIPCFNCAQTIGRAVDSVMKQTLLPAELLLIDDASKDDGQTWDMLNRLQSRYQDALQIRLLRLVMNGGPGSARNAGWEAASQGYLAFLDADDAWHPQKIGIQYQWMEKHPEIDVSGHLTMVHTGDETSRSFAKQQTSSEITYMRMLFSNCLSMRTVMLRKEGMHERFYSGKRYAEDYHLWLTLLSNGKRACRIDQVLAYSFKEDYGRSGLSANLWRMEQGELEAYNDLRRQKKLSRILYILVYVFSMLRYLRRLIFARLNRGRTLVKVGMI